MLRSLAWSIAVVLVAGMIAVLTTPDASGQTVVQHGARLAVPTEDVEPGPAGGPGTSAAGEPAPTAAPGAASAASTSASPAAASATTKAKVAPTTTAAPRAAAPAAAKAPAAPKLQPDAGSYPLTISGTSSVNGKGAAVPTSGSLVVEGRGSDQQHRMVGVPGGLVLVQRSNAAGVDLVSFSLTAGSKTLTFRPPSPVPFVRTDPGASFSWSVSSTDRSVGVSQTATVTGGGSVGVGGTAVPVVTVQRAFTVSGAVQGTVRLTSTVSQVDRLPVIQHQAINVRAALPPTNVVSDTTATLTSTRPR